MRARRLTVLLLLVAVGATACGSSSKGAASANTSTTAGNAPSSTAGGSGSDTTTTIKVSGDSGSSFCNLVRGELSAFTGTDFTGTSPTDLKKRYENISSVLSDAESKAPSQIKGDLETFSTAFDKVAKALSDANYDYTKLSPTTFAGLDTPAVKAASNHIEQYFTQVCHINTSS